MGIMRVMLRGRNLFAVKWDGVFYLVNLDTQGALMAHPPDSPDMFLRFVHLDQSIHDITPEQFEQIKQILTDYRA